MKMPISWYENNLKTSTRFYENKLKQLEMKKERLELLRKHNEFSALQIKIAKERKIDAYDADRFLVLKKGKKT